MATPPRLLALLAAVTGCLGLAIARLPQRPAPQGGCGPASLQAVCRQLGVPVTMPDLDRITGGESPMSSLAELRSAALALGLRAAGAEMAIGELRRNRPLGVLHLGEGHFVAVVGYTRLGPRVADPVLSGKVSVSVWPYDQLSERWDGRILVVTR